MITIYKSFQEIDFTHVKNRETVEAFLRTIMDGLHGKIVNIHCDVYAVLINDYLYPMTITTKNYHDSWIVSPYGQYVISLREEIEHHISSSFMRKIMYMGTDFLSFCLRQVENRVVYVHNFLVSTNLYSEQCPIDIKMLTEELTKAFPQHAIAFRSLNKRTAVDWMEKLARNHYQPFGSRVIYYWHPQEKLKKNERTDHKKDRKLLEKSAYVIEKGLKEDEASEMVQLYNLLYLDKYSKNNPQYTASFIYHLSQTDLFHFITLKDQKFVAFAGYFIMNEQMAAPFFGWDTRISERNGIYRMISHVLYQAGTEHQILMNHSGGAGGYKKMRGCKPEMEYTYMYTKHLRPKGRFFWSILRFFTHTIGGKLLWKYR